MKKKNHKFLIASFVGILIFGIYYYYDPRSEASSTDSPITSSLDTKGSTTPPKDTIGKANEDTAFLMKLASLTKIKIDTSLFTDKSFKLLVDNNIKLEPIPYGRKNPFLPTDGNIASNKVVFSLKTNPATSITTKSAILNGSIEKATSTNIYFEYGLTEDLGKVTPKVIPSLVGSLTSNVTLLDSKTTYFYRVVASINGSLTFGEIMSFNTN